MAKAKVVHSTDAATIIFRGDPHKPEPSLGVIKFPGGYVEVSRTKTGGYWAHISIHDKPAIPGEDHVGEIAESRIDYDYEHWQEHGIIDVPDADHITHIAIHIKRKESKQ